MNNDLINEGLENLNNVLETTVEIKPVEKVEKRGRHKLSCQCEKCEARKNIKKMESEYKKETTIEEKTVENDSDDFTDFEAAMNQFNDTINESDLDTETTTEKQISDQNKETLKPASVSGMMMLTVIDLAAPVLMLKIFGFFDDKYKDVDVRNVRMDKEEKKDLEELADIIAKEYISMHPLTLFAVSLGAVYYSKISAEIQ